MSTTSKFLAADWRVMVGIGITLFVIAACDVIPFGRSVDADREAEEPVFAVGAGEAERQRMIDSLRVNGEIEPAATVDVFPEALGDVRELTVRVGQAVERGAVIARIDQSRPGQSFVPSPVRAPISGTIIAVPVSVGSKVQQGQPVARIATTGVLQIQTHVPERFIGRLQPGQKAEIRVAAYPDAVFEARVVELSPVVDPATRTMETKLEFSEADARIRPGMFARVRIITEERADATVVPVNAVVTRLDTQYVFVITENDRVERRVVSLGLQSGDRIEITSGVSAGERIVVEGQNQLEAGVRVRLVGDEGAEAAEL